MSNCRSCDKTKKLTFESDFDVEAINRDKKRREEYLAFNNMFQLFQEYIEINYSSQHEGEKSDITLVK